MTANNSIVNRDLQPAPRGLWLELQALSAERGTVKYDNTVLKLFI